MQEDGFEFTMVTDSLADALGLKFPRRAMGILSGPNGGGKSLISQRLVFGFIGNGHKVLVITTELTTRGWIEQMDSIGYGMTDALDDGQLLVLSRFGSIAQTDPTVGIEEVLASPAIEHAEIIVIDSASSIIPKHLSAAAQFDLLNKIRGIASDDKLVLLTLDREDMVPEYFHMMRSSAEVVIDLSSEIIGGALKRQLLVTRFLRAAGPLQSTVGWRVEPGMGFIVDITAVS